jgi:hypothetical protein
MNVTSRPIERKARVGFLRPGHVEGAFIALLYLALLLLVALSVLGTFYGLRGEAAPIATPLAIVDDLLTAPRVAGLALLIQFVLTTIQYGSRQLSRRDRRWWVLYLVALGISVYYNSYAYWTPLTALVPWYLAGFLIVAGDILPEFIAVRRE